MLIDINDVRNNHNIAPTGFIALIYYKLAGFFSKARM